MAEKAVRWDSMNKDNTSMERLIAHFEAFNRSEGKTPKTVHWYTSCLNLLLDYLLSHDIEPVLRGMDVDVVRQYILHLQKRKRFKDHPYTPEQEDLLSPRTVQCYTRALKAFFSWLKS